MKLILKAALLAFMTVAGNAHAAAVSGQGTWETTLLGRDMHGAAVSGSDINAVFLYDTVLNVTWLRPPYANSSMTWYGAYAWASDLTVGAHSDWRLPTMIATPNATHSYAGGTDRGSNVRTKSGNATQYEAGQTVYSEMAHLWYSTLGNKAECQPGNASCFGAGGEQQPGWGLTNTGDFQGLYSNYLWSGRAYAPNLYNAWYFDPGYGYQGYLPKDGYAYAMAVRDGDVLATPIPAAAWLMLSGIGVLGAAVRRRKSVAVQP
jgi:hypothetical protein